MRQRCYNYFAPTALIAVLFSVLFVSTGGGVEASPNLTPQTDASTSLSRGRSLLKQGHADQALPLLQSALSSFTQANDARGIAAAEDALGDLYLVQGQYKVALEHYQKAYQSFTVAAGKDQTNATAANSVASRAGST